MLTLMQYVERLAEKRGEKLGEEHGETIAESHMQQLLQNLIADNRYEDLIRISKDTPLYNFFIKKYRTGLSDV